MIPIKCVINIREIFGNVGGDVFGSDVPRLMDGDL